MTTAGNTCLACGSRELSFWARARDIEYFSVPEEFSYFHCNTCSSLSISPVPEDRLQQIYPPTYYSFAGKPFSLPEKVKDILDQRLFKSIFRTIDPNNARKQFSALDVGGGSGWVMDTAKRAEPRLKLTVIVDFDEKAGERAREAGHAYFQGRIEEFNSNEKFDLIMMLNLIEHVRDPVAVLQKMQKILAAGGRILIKTPNHDSLDARIFRHRNWGGYHCPRHWVLFTPEGFRLAAARAGLQVETIALTQGAPFWTWSILGWMADKGFIKSGHDKPLWRHPLAKFLVIIFAALDFARRPFMRTSQMFVILKA